MRGRKLKGPGWNSGDGHVVLGRLWRKAAQQFNTLARDNGLAVTPGDSIPALGEGITVAGLLLMGQDCD